MNGAEIWIAFVKYGRADVGPKEFLSEFGKLRHDGATAVLTGSWETAGLRGTNYSRSRVPFKKTCI